MSDNKKSNNVVSFLNMAMKAIEKGDDEYEKVFGIVYCDDEDDSSEDDNNNNKNELQKKINNNNNKSN